MIVCDNSVMLVKLLWPRLKIVCDEVPLFPTPFLTELKLRCSVIIQGHREALGGARGTFLAPRGLHNCIKSSPTTSVTILERLEVPTIVLAPL